MHSSYTHTLLALPSHSHSSRAPVTLLSFPPRARAPRVLLLCVRAPLVISRARVTLTLLSRSSVLVLPSCSFLARASLVLLSCSYSYCDRTPSYCVYAPPTLLILMRLSCCAPVVLTHLSCSSHTTSALRFSLWLHVVVCVRGGGTHGYDVWGGDRSGVPLGFFLQYGVSGDISPRQGKIETLPTPTDSDSEDLLIIIICELTN